MNKMGFRLVGGYFLALSMVVLVGFYASTESEKSLREAIAKNSVFVAEQMLSNINISIRNWIDRFEQRGIGESFIAAAERSNREFELPPSVGSRLESLDSGQRASPYGPPAADRQKLYDAPLSRTLRTLYIDYFKTLKAEIAVPEVVVTNKHGAAIAFVGTPARLRLDADPLWRAAMSAGTQVGEVEAEDRTGRTLLPIASTIPDPRGEAAGIFLAKLYVDDLIAEATSSSGKYLHSRIALVTGEGRMVYSTEAYAFGADISMKSYFKKIEGDSGSFMADEDGRRSLVAYYRGKERLGFAGPPLILLYINDADEVLAPSILLRDRIAVASAILLAAGVLAALLIARSITKPVKILQSAMAEITKGNLGNPIDTRAKDELGDLSRSFVEMQESLGAMTAFAERIADGDLGAQSVKRSGADLLGKSLDDMLTNLRMQSGEILEGVSVLAAATSEISVSTSQFAANSSETAAAVSQTTTTIEEVKQTTHLSSEKAKQMAASARTTETVAQAGRDSVEETTLAMQSIRDQMNAIGESIVRLNEQGSSIGEIASTVSDLADQSNLLAVNAAIEAAKAGDQGKGFVVVAQEIKSLAEQSKRAVIQVRGILSELQKATSVAVMLTERGSKAVELGIAQAGAAKRSIEGLTRTIEDAALGAELIAVTSEEQLVGMDQVAMAMESIQMATTQGVEGTRQLEAAALNLHGVGQKLKLLVGRTRM